MIFFLILIEIRRMKNFLSFVYTYVKNIFFVFI